MKTTFSLKSPVWLFIGAFLVLFPIFAYLTMENINRQKENSARILMEKGTALIRSFEAGTRMGIMGRFGTGFKLQRLLSETAQLPDIEYLLVVNERGKILAHGNPEQIGRIHGSELDLAAVAKIDKLQWRLLPSGKGPTVFEVFGRFSPSPDRRERHPEHGRMSMHMFSPPMADPDSPQPELIIFVGLDMDTVESAQTADTRHLIITGAVFMMLAFSGITLLLLMGRYRATRESLLKVQAFSDQLVENMPIGLIAVDEASRVAAMNQVAGALLGLPPRESLGKSGGEILPSELMAQVSRIDPEKGMIEAEIECRVRNEVIPLETAAVLFKDQNLNFMGHIILFKDQREIKNLRKEIIRNQRLVTVGRLAAGVAHEIRNPLSSIKGFAVYFKERYGKNPEDAGISNIMIQEVERLNMVVGQLLEFAKPVRIQKKKTSLTALIADSLKLVEKQAEEKGIALITHFDEDYKIPLDPNRMNQVLLNLYLNAIESMGTGGRLQIDGSSAPEGNGIIIRISDTGCGITPKDLPHIFDLYYTTKSSGTGLGLAIVHNIIEAHGGRLTVESTHGKGTVFTLFLPDDENRQITGFPVPGK